MARLLDLRLVAVAIKEVPAHADGSQPVGASLVYELLPVRFKGRPEYHLRKQGTPCGIYLCLSELSSQMRSAALWSRRGGVSLQRGEFRARQIQARQRAREHMPCIERQSKHIVQRRS